MNDDLKYREELIKLYEMATNNPLQAQKFIEGMAGVVPPYQRAQADKLTVNDIILSSFDFSNPSRFNDFVYKIWNYAEKMKYK